MAGWLKIKAAAAYCNSGERTIRRWLKKGLRYSRLPSGAILIKCEWMDEYLEQYEVKGNAADLIVEQVISEF